MSGRRRGEMVKMSKIKLCRSCGELLICKACGVSQTPLSSSVSVELKLDVKTYARVLKRAKAIGMSVEMYIRQALEDGVSSKRKGKIKRKDRLLREAEEAELRREEELDEWERDERDWIGRRAG